MDELIPHYRKTVAQYHDGVYGDGRGGAAGCNHYAPRTHHAAHAGYFGHACDQQQYFWSATGSHVSCYVINQPQPDAHAKRIARGAYRQFKPHTFTSAARHRRIRHERQSCLISPEQHHAKPAELCPGVHPLSGFQGRPRRPL